MFVRIVSALLLGSFGWASVAQAQTPSRQAVLESMETCRTIDVDFVRQACLASAEAFLADERAQRTGTAPSAPPAAVPAPSVSTPAPVEAAPVDVATNDAVAEAEEEAKRRRFGLLRRSERESTNDEELTVTVTGIGSSGEGRNQFRLSDGSLLVRFSGEYALRAPSSLPAQARLERRFLGSKWLTFDEFPDRSYKVRVLPAGN